MGLAATILPMVPAKVESHVGSKRYKELLNGTQELAKKKSDAKSKRKELFTKLREKWDKEKLEAKGGKPAADGKASKKTKKGKKGGKTTGAPLTAEAKTEGGAAVASAESAETKKEAGAVLKNAKKRPLRSIQMRRKNQVDLASKPADVEKAAEPAT